jgi:hypothetical protein
MTEEPRLDAALRLVADAERPPADPVADLLRARRAARRRVHRRLRVGSAAAALLVVAGMAATGTLSGHAGRATDAAGPGASTGTDLVRLVAQPLAADPYTFELTPQGWSVQGQSPGAVTIAPDDGSASTNPDDFVGKLVIVFDLNPPGSKAFVYDGRRFWIHLDSGYTTLSTRTRPGEPAGVVRVQYPAATGWTMTSMLRFLASVHVGPGARPGLG